MATAPQLWNQAVQQLVVARRFDATRAAQAFAVLNLSGADAFIAAGGRICTGVHVVGVTSGAPVEIELAGGRTLRAACVVDATQMAITSRFNMPLREAAYRTYVIALDVAPGYVRHALFWDTLDPYHYVRVAQGNFAREVLLVGGDREVEQDRDEGPCGRRGRDGETRG